MKYLFLLLLVGVTIIACRPKSSSESGSEAVSMTLPSELPADFVVFYQKFHEDSLFQMAHIVWPLQGQTGVQIDSTHSEKRPTQWQKESWRMHRAVDFSKGDFSQEWTSMSETLLIERIRTKGANYALERRFAKSGDVWELIYYADMQEL
jgi:hypothetical protein